MNYILELIVGPMFSGKTTRLIERYNELIKSGKKCIAINYALDTRYGENKIVSHDGLNIDCLSIKDLDEISIDLNDNNSDFSKAEYILINEAQFFTNLKTNIMYLINISKKNVILCGLDLDYKREKFGELMDLGSIATKIEYLRGKCNTKKCNYPSQFTHRLVECDQQILIGTNEYIPVCEECYRSYHELSNKNAPVWDINQVYNDI
jgi:thymidine kinase